MTSNFPRWTGDSTTPFVLHLVQDLQRLGWAIDVLAPHAPGTASHENLDEVYVERFRYLWPSSLETVCYGGGALINLRERRSNLLKVPLLVGAELAAVMWRLARRHYDLVNSHWVLPQGLVAMMTARPLRIPHVATVHGGDVFALRGRAMRALKRFAFHRADAVTVNSSATEKAVLEIAPRARHVHRIPMGVSTNARPTPGVAAELRARYRRDRGPMIVFVGRLVDEKGVEDLIQAVKLLLPGWPDIGALIVGEGQHRSAFERLRRELGLEDRIHFVGWVSPNLVPNYLAAGDIFVAPSRHAPDGWIEAQGLTVIEAMSTGIPVVATEVGGLVDIVRHEETGLLVPQRSPRQIAAAVERLARDPSLRHRLRKGGLRLARIFSRESTAERFSSVFGSLIQGERRRRV